METVSPLPVTPRSHSGHSQHQKSSPITAQKTTRFTQPADDYQQALSAPGSQESFWSVQSTGSSVLQPPPQHSNSNLSQRTNYTDATSPVSSQHTKLVQQLDNESGQQAKQPKTPDYEDSGFDVGAKNVVASPISVVSPTMNNATKRTASGHVKNMPSLPNTPFTSTQSGKRSRTDSISSTGSRASELAASLKTRLGYAMAKVQHGWENKNIGELEQLSAPKQSPYRHSMSHVDYSRRPFSSGLTNGAARLSMYDAMDSVVSPPTKRHSGNYSSYGRHTSSQPDPRSAAPFLQPAPELRPNQHRHRHTQSTHSVVSTTMSPPRTPLTTSQSSQQPRSGRLSTIRTDAQTLEAERDALQALFQLGSPHASQPSNSRAQQHRDNESQASSSQASPLRSEFLIDPRRATYERSESGSSLGVAGERIG